MSGINTMSSSGRISLLIVDDEEEIQNVLMRHFTMEGYDVQTASNGVEALRVMDSHSFEIVISDIMMPEMNGIELLKKIKDNYPLVHVISITGYVTLSNLLDVLRYGADTCIFKPFKDLEEVTQAVEDAMKSLTKWQTKLKELSLIRSH